MSKTIRDDMRVRETQERRRSGAAGLHLDKRTRRRRTRKNANQAAIRDSFQGA